jgi:phosphate transport system permease protein
MRRLQLNIFHFFCTLSVIVLLGVITIFLGFLLKNGAQAINTELFFGDTPAWEAITGSLPVWEGIWPALIGTLCLIGLTLLLALLPGIGCGIFLAEFAPSCLKNWGNSIIDTLAGTPSIVMGLFGFTLILFLRDTFWPDANTSLILAASCLALLVLPVIIVTTREALESIPAQIRITAASLGISKIQCLRFLLLPTVSRSILSGVILAIGRSAEDTAVIMLTGAVANSGLPDGLGSKFEALPFSIYVTAAEYQDEIELAQGFGTALVLLCFSSLILFCATVIEKRLKQRWQRGNI